MKKLILVSMALVAVSGVALADAVYGTIGTPANHNVTVSVIIPPRVGINIDAAEHTKVLDLSADATYPPAVATYWTFLTNPNVIAIIATGNYRYDYTTDGTGLLAGLTVGEFEYQTVGWGAGAWTAFGAGANLEDPAARTAGWVNRNMNYRVSLDGAETAGANDLIVTYTVTAEL
ncbi:MAG: hypothetical protein MUF78_08070 [Candidatus Edwardsbacteria bacterium]|jgi:hypothetical protein|nr:hypothetical protein [Candidatus Edwardsbacteria bacterium]